MLSLFKRSREFWLRVTGKLGSYTGFALFIGGILNQNPVHLICGIIIAAIGCFIHEVGEE